MIVFSKQCIRCSYRDLEAKEFWQCKAFPKGIPDDILSGTFDHRQPHTGDKGIRFEPERIVESPQQYIRSFAHDVWKGYG